MNALGSGVACSVKVFKWLSTLPSFLGLMIVSCLLCLVCPLAAGQSVSDIAPPQHVIESINVVRSNLECSEEAQSCIDELGSIYWSHVGVIIQDDIKATDGSDVGYISPGSQVLVFQGDSSAWVYSLDDNALYQAQASGILVQGPSVAGLPLLGWRKPIILGEFKSRGYRVSEYGAMTIIESNRQSPSYMIATWVQDRLVELMINSDSFGRNLSESNYIMWSEALNSYGRPALLRGPSVSPDWACWNYVAGTMHYTDELGEATMVYYPAASLALAHGGVSTPGCGS